MIKADDILLFVQVVENGSFSKVAEQRQLTNSVVSKRIARLEKGLNVQLLYRTTRKLSLTDAGRLLYGKGKLAKQAIQDATNVVSGYSDEIRGTIKITAPLVSANLVVSKALAEFCKIHPNVVVNLQINNQLVNLIEEGYDLAIRTANLQDSSLVARRLIDSKWVVCASPEYLQKHALPTTPDDLLKHECLLYKNESGSAENWLFSYGTNERFINVNGSFASNNLDAICAASLAHLGIAFLPQALVYEHIKQHKLTPILQEHTSKMMGIYAVYPNCRQPDEKLKLLIEHLRGAFLAQESHFH